MSSTWGRAPAATAAPLPSKAASRSCEAATPLPVPACARERKNHTPRMALGQIPLRHATAHNLRDLNVDIPAGVLTVLTGVAGSGKSSLAGVLVDQHPDSIVVDQRAVATNRRSNPATYTGIADPIRKVFARVNGVPAPLFSANSDGACPECHGQGVIF